ncbi:MAG: hypothetical protein JWM27_4539 [Gemmatimonadetes bacterium]|nr:hypothetical protein [Gemmatimonadota bacterium]
MNLGTPLALALLALPASLPAQVPPPVAASHAVRASVAHAVRTALPIRVDGRLDEEAWASARPLTGFTQVTPDEGAPASEATEARILYDGEALYVGFRLHDRGHVSTRLGRRDMDLGDADWVGLVIDSYHDHRTAVSFDLNPGGVRRDETKTDAGDDNSWDAVWQGAAARDTGGWTAEYRIPFSQLRFNPAAEQTWGLQLERIIGRRKEYAVLAFTPRKERGGIATYAHLTGLRDLHAGRRLEVLPYSVAKAEYVDPHADPYRGDRELGASAGLDLKYRVTPDLALAATLNPDFGQVEVDPATINLSAYETFYQDKRPFFVEGSEIFAFGGGGLPTGGDAFYTRRIGGRSSPLAPAGDSADVPALTRILGAAKLSGKTAGGWSLGVMEALTAREHARFRLAGADSGMLVEPLANFLVARARRDLREGASSVGWLATAVNRDLSTDALRAGLRSSAYTGGMDFRHEWAGRAWAVSGFAAGTRLGGSPSALLRAQQQPDRYFQRPDAAHLRVDSAATSMSGYSGRLSIEKQAGEHWSGGADVDAISPGFETNDLGYQRRGDRLDAQAYAAYAQRKPGRTFRSYRVDGSARLEHNYAGQKIYDSYDLSSHFQTPGYWAVTLEAGGGLRALDDRLTRGGPLAIRPGNWRVSAGVDSDPRRDVTGSGAVYWQQDGGGAWSYTASLSAGLKTSPRWNLSVGPVVTRGYNPAQLLGSEADDGAAATFGRRYVFARYMQTTVSMDTRLNYTFDPSLSLEVYAQPFVSRADFGGRVSLRAARTYDFDAYSGAIAVQDFEVRSVRGNAVLRWEWRTGSTLYLAWQQSRQAAAFAADIRTLRDGPALFDSRPDNVFLLKVSYWLNP